MNKKDKLILILLGIGLLMFITVYFIIIPKQRENRDNYLLEQLNSTTHDINYILKYKNKYMGNASNIINLYYHLPLADVNKDFEILSNKLTLIVNYKDTVSNIGDEKVKSSLIYNGVASFALIDNLNKIVYNFTGVTYNVVRKDIEKHFGDLENITDKKIWNKKVRNMLHDKDYVFNTFDKLFFKQ
ncbi:DUF4825 domain-containing protein [Clostridiaceae bacterium M8S5]|nr:DUF4825 domain-containing protein [Clostridiaceae bacterium M8S5]